jgi:serine protease inhibitor
MRIAKWTSSVLIFAMLAAATPASDAVPKAKPKPAPFSFRMFDAIVTSNPNSNLVFSPYSVAEALAMTRLGANSTTAKQIDTAVTGTDQQIDNNARLAVRTQLTSPTNAQFGIDVNVANPLWLAENYPIQPAFRSNAQQYFGAISTETNFADTAAAAKLINEWISTATKKQIENVISDTTLNPATKAVMVNALYFRAAWSRKFSKDQTVPAAFRLDTKRRVQAPTMTGNTTVRLTPTGTEVDMATITVDEDGTTAAAVTVLVASPVSARPPNAAKCPTSVRVDRPFTYVIQHVGTNEVLFAGQIIDPSRS